MQDGLYNMDTLVKIAIWGVCLYVAYCGFLFLAQRSMLFPRSAIPVVIEKVVLKSPYLLRTIKPGIQDLAGKRVLDISRMGKQIVMTIEGDVYLISHLMVNGRFKWNDCDAIPKTKSELLAIQFDTGTLMLTETGTRRRASLHIIQGQEKLHEFDSGGLEVLSATVHEVQQVILRRNHTLKRVLTDPRFFSGIGKKYSDEILFCANLSPVKWTSRLLDQEIEALHSAMQDVFEDRLSALRKKIGKKFPPETRSGFYVYN